MWCKMANLELHTRVPLMLRVPWMPTTMGTSTAALVELVDVYPTLAALAGIDVSSEGLEGKSLLPLLVRRAGPEPTHATPHAPGETSGTRTHARDTACAAPVRLPLSVAPLWLTRVPTPPVHSRREARPRRRAAQRPKLLPYFPPPRGVRCGAPPSRAKKTS